MLPLTRRTCPYLHTPYAMSQDVDRLGYIGEAVSGSSSVKKNDAGGWFDYNDTSTAASPLVLPADTWVDIPNDGLGAFSNDTYRPLWVTRLMDPATGYIDPTQLNLGDVLFIRNDYTVSPSINDSLLTFRYALGGGAFEYTLGQTLNRLDNGTGDYRFALASEAIYMGDENTRNNPIKMQLNCSVDATCVNAGSFVFVATQRGTG